MTELDHYACNSLERLLHRGDSRQTRRQFQRLLARHWPIKPDPKLHPRLTLFVERYTAAEAENSGR